MKIKKIIIKALWMLFVAYSNGLGFVSAQDKGVNGISLIYAEAQVESPFVEIAWATLGEDNASNFKVEHSADGLNWDELFLVQANGPSGGMLCEYNATHENPHLGNNYYRIVYIDADGNSTECATLVVKVDFVPVNTFPNPVDDLINIMVVMPEECVVQLSLIGTDGKYLEISNQHVHKGLNKIVVDASYCNVGLNILWIKCKFFEETCYVMKK
jgi:hypothetical protein